MDYYIQDESGDMQGPYNLMSMILKIRNGQLQPATMIATERGGQTQRAQDILEIAEIFADESRAEAAPPLPDATSYSRNFPDLLSSGFEFLRQSTTAIVCSGVVLLAWLIISYAFIFGHGIILSFIGLALCFFSTGLYVYSMLRLVRGNPVDSDLLMAKLKATAKPLALLSLIFAGGMLPGLIIMYVALGSAGIFIGLPLLFLSIIVMFSLLLFPLFALMELEFNLVDALHAGKKILFRNGNLGNAFALVMVNIIAFPLLPITLPITMGAIAELFDESVHNI